ncbi:sugar porter family MFS transporter [Natrinema longum]|uniref:Sugar porter family MFS transporter n=1 Tax=Natrinema longum TaxID=370324 RepID=A0A8A2U556_9EURY|nr:sugar porter family MFS transporter [Natrinema longum]MBZ6494840.1 sugar porter family MFS transporter [Natrinema longum]QSW83856.1 sugar porter family MFS transporter [Natrinema longum]
MENTELAGNDRNSFIYVVAALAALNGLLFGFDTGVISGAMLYIRNTFELATVFGYSMNTSLVEGVIVSGAMIGAIIGAALGGRLADRLGRRRLILVGAVVFFVGSLIMAIAPTVEILIVGRIVDGIGVGFASVVGPLYISEISPPKIRGSLVSLNQLTITSGILIAYLVNFAFAGGGEWRWMLGLGMVPAAVLFVGMLFMPESPRWLYEHGRESDAREVLARTRVETQVEGELREIKETIRTESGTLRDLFEPWVRPMLIVGVGLAAFQQVTGINTVMYYAPTILESTGFADTASILATVGIGVVNVVMTVVAVLLIDRTGRRPLLLSGLAGMTVMLAVLGVAFYLPGLSGAIGWIATGSLMLYVAFFAIGLGPVFWLLISEIYPMEVRGTAMGVVTVVNWAGNLLVSLTFLRLIDIVGQAGTFWLYGALSVLALLFCYLLVPETKGRTLEAIEADLRETAFGRDAGEQPRVTEIDD